MKNPTELEMVAAYAREFPGTRIGGHERAFLATVHIARSHGVGWGFMRQAVGMHWKEADAIGYIDDDRVRDLFAKPLADMLARVVAHMGGHAEPGDPDGEGLYDRAVQLLHESGVRVSAVAPVRAMGTEKHDA